MLELNYYQFRSIVTTYHAAPSPQFVQSSHVHVHTPPTHQSPHVTSVVPIIIVLPITTITHQFPHHPPPQPHSSVEACHGAQSQPAHHFASIVPFVLSIAGEDIQTNHHIPQPHQPHHHFLAHPDPQPAPHHQEVADIV